MSKNIYTCHAKPKLQPARCNDPEKPPGQRLFVLKIVAAFHLYNTLLGPLSNNEGSQFAALDAPAVKAFGIFTDLERSFGVVTVDDGHGLRVRIHIGGLMAFRQNGLVLVEHLGRGQFMRSL